MSAEEFETALTEEERALLGLVARGLANREIAMRLSLPESAVKAQIHSVLEKLRARLPKPPSDPAPRLPPAASAALAIEAVYEVEDEYVPPRVLRTVAPDPDSG